MTLRVSPTHSKVWGAGPHRGKIGANSRIQIFPMRKTGLRNWWTTDLSACLALTAVFFLTFFRAIWAFRVNWQNDDGCYLATLGRLLAFDTSGVCTRENYYAPGAPLLWMPVGLLAKLVSYLTKTDVWFWAVSGISLFSFCLWGASLVLLTSVLSHWEKTRHYSRWAKVLLAQAILLNVPVLYYAIHWTIMPHTAEFFLSAMVFLFLCRNRPWVAFFTSAVLCLTRYNDFPVLLMVVGHLFDNKTNATSKTARRVIGGSACIIISWIAYKALWAGYGRWHVDELISRLNLTSVQRFLFDPDSGMVWMSPWWILSLVSGIFYFPRLSYVSRAGLIWIVTEFILLAGWTNVGGDFGFRYSIGSYIASLSIFLEISSLVPRFYPSFIGITGLNAVWLTYLSAIYRTINSLSPQYVGAANTGIVIAPPDNFYMNSIHHLLDPEMYREVFRQNFPRMKYNTLRNSNSSNL